ncbi:MAG: polysaccharide deacetylase family protein [Acidobacteriota bacterium]|nr:polysaccharide deacetylase family protein [Acidobacteriota bacterium]
MTAARREGPAVRIDVDFRAGLLRAVPFFLDALGASGMHATFFVVTGSNRPASILRRLGRKGYLRRLRRLGVARTLFSLRPGPFSSGSMRLESASSARVLRRIVAEGHELAVHGYDHAWWADHVWDSDEPELAGEVERAFATMERVTGRSGFGWGSPNWRTTETVLRLLHARAVPYFSDCWGIAPFLTADEAGSVVPTIHLPITLPSLEGSMLERRIDGPAAIAAVFEPPAPRPFDVICFHDYYEGLARRELFTGFLNECRRRRLRTITLADAARRLQPELERLPVHRLARGPLPGFTGEVSWQGPIESRATRRSLP